jgi:outer membrane protein OmpA-like peptidoglycan-associated protein
MKSKFLLLFSITLLLGASSINTFAGKKDDPAAKLPFKRKMKWADNLYKQGSFYTAEEYYAQLQKEQPRNPYVSYQLAECSWFNRDYVKAAHYYGEAYSLAPELYPEAPYKEGMMLKMCSKYEEAIERFQFFIKNYKGRSKKMKLYAQRYIDGALMAINSKNDPGLAFVKNAGPNVNTPYSESAPYPLGDSALLFATMNVPQGKLIEVGKDKRKDYVSRFMWTPKEYDRTKIKDTFEVAMKFEDGRFNDTKYHVSNGSWSPGKTRFYYTKCLEKSNIDTGRIGCKIYVSEFKKGVWQSSKEMPAESEVNLEGSSNTNPFCAMIGKKEVLFFSSDRKMQSAGGFDIWYSVYDSSRKTYRRPQNCGKKLNSFGDDVTPFYDSEKGKLYFASNGWASLGGFDIYTADGGPSRYTNLRNMGFPINSPADDMYYIQDPTGKDNAYIVSNRLGSYYVKNPTCCDDIWRVIKEPSFFVRGKVVDEETNELIPQVAIKMTDEGTNTKKDTSYSQTGNFMFYTPMGKNYNITADKQKYISGRTVVSTTDRTAMDPDDTTDVTIYMHKITSDFEFHVRNVYYNFDKKDFQPDSYTALDTLVNFMRDNPSVSVEIRSHTDDKGTDNYNDDLSINRAEAVMNYMVTKGIDRGRMIAKGEGKNAPLAPNKIGAKDNPVGRQYNRRTEFRIIGDLQDKRIIYDQNKPDFIDRTGGDKRNKNLTIPTGSDDDDTPVYEETPAEAQPGNRVNDK